MSGSFRARAMLLAVVVVGLVAVAVATREERAAASAVEAAVRSSLAATAEALLAVAVVAPDDPELPARMLAALRAHGAGAGIGAQVEVGDRTLAASGAAPASGAVEAVARLPDGRPVRAAAWSASPPAATGFGVVRRAAAWALALLPLLLLGWFALLAAPLRSLRALQEFVDRCPEGAGGRLDPTAHVAELRGLADAVNRAADALAARQRRLDHLGEEARRFAGAARHSAVGFLMTDRSGRVEWSNEGFEWLSGFPAAALVGRVPAVALASIGAEPETLSSIAQRMRAGEAFRADVMIRRSDGARRWLHVEGEPIHDEGGEVVGFVALHTDAEERVRAVANLRRGQDILRAVARGSEALLRAPAWSEVVDEVIAAVGAAARGRRALLYQVVDAAAEPRIVALRGRWPNPPTFAAPVATEGAVGAWAEPLAEGRALLVTGGGAGGDAVAFWGSGAGVVAVAPVLVAGAWWGFFAVEAVPGSAGWSEVDQLALRTAADAIAAAIERHDGEAALARERSFAERVLSGIAQGVVVSDAEGRIAYANPALLAMLGRPIEVVRGRRLGDFAAPAAADLAARGELVLAADGAPRHVLVTESEVGEAVGEGRIAVVTDITERSRLEADLKLTAALAEAANDAKTHFLALVSHELRTPLNAIVGFAQLAALDADSPDVRESLRQIHGAGRHLGGLIDDLIDLASAETGDLKVEFEQVDLSEVAARALRLMAPLAEAAGLDLQSSLPGPLFVVADPRRATQVVLNLLGNAVKYVQPGGRVTLRVVRDAAAGRARLEVEDTGPGIGEEELERLFRPFERFSTARDRGGSGIGLALSRVLAERMGGRLLAESQPGRGSRFWLELPRARTRPPERPRQVVDSPP